MRADVRPKATNSDQPPAGLSPEALGILQAIDGLSPYELPNLKLKTDEKYAHIAKDLAPFHHVRPFKEFFLTQMEYTGPGRGPRTGRREIGEDRLYRPD